MLFEQNGSLVVLTENGVLDVAALRIQNVISSNDVRTHVISTHELSLGRTLGVELLLGGSTHDGSST